MGWCRDTYSNHVIESNLYLQTLSKTPSHKHYTSGADLLKDP